MITIWDVLGRSESGPFVKEEEFDWQVGLTARKMVQKYGIRYNPEQVVPSDDDLADRVYQASLDLFLELGTYCRDTGRLVKFTSSTSSSQTGTLSSLRTWAAKFVRSTTSRSTPCLAESDKVMATTLTFALPRAFITPARTPGLLTS